MFKPRVLLVDDLPDVRATLAGLLKDAGYEVCPVSSRPAALDAAATSRFHVAILDVRLDETDVENREGLQLLHELKAYYPSLSAIILTAFADVAMVKEALRPGPSGEPLAFDFVEKSQIHNVLASVRQALEQDVHINEQLHIHDPQGLLEQLPKQLRFNIPNKPASKDIVAEAEELLRKLFYDCDRIELHATLMGYSGATVFQVIPWYINKGRGEPVIAKLGEYDIVSSEHRNFKDFVEGRVGGHRLPRTLQFARTQLLGGLLYTFAGLGATVNFATFCATATAEQIVAVLDNLFHETCFPWRQQPSVLYSLVNLRDFGCNLLGLDHAKLALHLEHMTRGRHLFRQLENGTRLRLDFGPTLQNPLPILLTTNAAANVLITTIHGDLQGYNVLVDKHSEAWLIDFANTRSGPRLQDYASFEAFLLLSVVGDRDLESFYAWDQVLYRHSVPLSHGLPAVLEEDRSIRRTHTALCALRQFVWEEHGGSSTRAYFLLLAFNLLKVMTIRKLSANLRDHALLATSVIAERLVEMD